MSKLFKSIVDSSTFNYLIIGVIILAGILVGLETYDGVMASYGSIIHLLDKIILGIFILEIAIKMAANGSKPLNYFKDPWNIFDFSIVFVCLLPVQGQFVAVLRLARILRVLKLVTAIPKLQILVGALLKSIPSMFYVSILLSLLFYVYAVMATFMFKGNDPLHFGSLELSMLSLFRVVTLEDWTDIMYIQMYGSDVYSYPPPAELANFTSQVATPEAFPIFSPIFFGSFVLLGTMVMLNLFIGIIMTGMDEAKAEEENKLQEEKSMDDSASAEQKIVQIEQQLVQLQQSLSSLKRKI